MWGRDRRQHGVPEPLRRGWRLRARERARLGSGIMVIMWYFLTRRLRRWLFFAFGAPVLSWVLGKVGDQLEVRNGPTRTSRTLQQGRYWLRRSSRGPLARRGRHR